MKTYLILITFLLFSTFIIAQEIRFTYTVNDMGSTSIVTVSAFKVDNTPTTENISSFNYGFYFKSNETQINGLAAGAVTMNMTAGQLASSVNGTLAGWAPDLTGAVQSVNTTFEGNTYDRLFIGAITDGNFAGSNLGTTVQPILTLTFDNSTGQSSFGDFVYMGASDTNTTWEYSNTSFMGFPVISLTTRTQALPIDIKTFSATKDGDRNARLEWTTSSEVNSDYFGVERSKDGVSWESVGRVAAAGNSSSDLLYSYIDEDLPLSRTSDNIFYYRLKLTDLDGSFEYSDVRGVNFAKELTGNITVYPNPAAQQVNVDITDLNLENGEVRLSVFDVNGRQVIDKIVYGNGIELIDVTSWPASSYQFVIKQGETIHQQRVIKID